MSDLLPCPFCGGKPYLVNAHMAGCAYVVCTDCRAQGDDGSKDRVINAWNRRAIPAADARAEALKEAAAVAFMASTSKASGTERKKIAAAIRALIPETKP